MKHPLLIFLLLYLNIITIAQNKTPILPHPQPPPTNANWQVGDEWIVDVEVYDRGDDELIQQIFTPDANIWGASGLTCPTQLKYDSTKIDYYYSVSIKIENIEVYQKTPCWKMTMMPFMNKMSSKGEKSKSEHEVAFILDQKYELWINKSDYSLVKVEYIGQREWLSPDVMNYKNNIPILSGYRVSYVPYNIIPFAMNNNIPNIHLDYTYRKSNVFSLNKVRNNSTSIITLLYFDTINDAYNTWITQSWKVGAKWWSTYEKRSKDRVFMRAKLREERE